MSEVKKIDPESRDYDLKDIQVDARFTQTTKEFFLTMGVYLVFAALMIVNLFVVGGDNVANYTYVLGFPLWIFNEIVLLIGSAVMEAAYYFLSWRVFSEFSFHTQGFRPAIALPLVCLLFAYLAARAVFRDELMVRAADRIR